MIIMMMIIQGLWGGKYGCIFQKNVLQIFGEDGSSLSRSLMCFVLFALKQTRK